MSRQCCCSRHGVSSDTPGVFPSLMSLGRRDSCVRLTRSLVISCWWAGIRHAFFSGCGCHVFRSVECFSRFAWLCCYEDDPLIIIFGVSLPGNVLVSPLLVHLSVREFLCYWYPFRWFPLMLLLL